MDEAGFNPEASSDEEEEQGMEADLQGEDEDQEEQGEKKPRKGKFLRPSPQKLMKVETAKWERRRIRWGIRRILRMLRDVVGCDSVGQLLEADVAEARQGLPARRFRGGGEDEWSVTSDEVDFAGDQADPDEVDSAGDQG